MIDDNENGLSLSSINQWCEDDTIVTMMMTIKGTPDDAGDGDDDDDDDDDCDDDDKT